MHFIYTSIIVKFTLFTCSNAFTQMPIREKYCMFRFNTSVYSTVGTEYELKTQFSLHPFFQHAAVCFQTLF